ncbi:MAG: CmcI family methyltransferase [Mucilaginibacter sp.]|uniref:CmcI family methyltransferase n=1 Tax=Mucilaginibacter sp. TaxID=1882438 RepID=UPI0031A9E935
MLRRFFKKTPADEKIEISVKSISDGHHKVSYKGIKAIRCPFDYVIYQMIICELKPDLVIEIGTNNGGGALYIADLMESIGHGLLHTIDVIKQSDPVLALHPRIKLFTDGWENYDTSLAEGYGSVLIIEDSSHTYQNTLAALNKFAPLITKNSYLIVEDGIVNALGFELQYGGGPLRAIREFLQSNKNFEVDRKWCDLFGKNATFNVNGYLKRLN